MCGVPAFLRETLGSLWRKQERAPCDGLRGLAVLWVLCFHALQLVTHAVPGLGIGLPDLGPRLARAWWPVALASSGELGVDLFLVLSGFLIGGSLVRTLPAAEAGRGGDAGRSGSWVGFYLRRWFRIMPAYAVAALVDAAADAASGRPPSCPGSGWWAQLLFVNNFTWQRGFGETPAAPCLGQSWSIAVEFQLYVATPPLFALAGYVGSRLGVSPRRCVAAAFALAWVACCALRLQYVLGTDLLSQAETHLQLWAALYLSTQYRYAPYAAGVVAAVALAGPGGPEGEGAESERPGRPALGVWAARAAKVLACACIAVASALGGDMFVTEWAGFKVQYRQRLRTLALLHAALLRPLLGAAVAYWLALACSGRARRLARLLSAPAWRPLAGLSYSLYLQQLVGQRLLAIPFLVAAAPSLLRVPVWQGALAAYFIMALYVLGTLPLALLSYAVVERPGILLGQRVLAALSRLGGPARVAPAAATAPAPEAADPGSRGSALDERDRTDLEVGGLPRECSGQAALPPAVRRAVSGGGEGLKGGARPGSPQRATRAARGFARAPRRLTRRVTRPLGHVGLDGQSA